MTQITPYSLSINPQRNQTYLLMKINIAVTQTSQLPLTYSFLEKNAPGVLKTRCFNDKKQPFKKEVKDTELGHLFEHLLLDHLCEVKSKYGETQCTHNGETIWDWQKDKKGTFHIYIDAASKDSKYLEKALEKTCSIFNNLLALHKLDRVIN